MNEKNHYESRLWKVLENEGLADLAQFHQGRFFDEVPLYSREANVAFLPRHQVNLLLLRFSLKYLNAVISYEEHHTPFFAAITVHCTFEDDPIVPNLFVWSGPISKLSERLPLGPVFTDFGKEIKQLVTKLRWHDRFAILEQEPSTSDLSRIFIAPTRAPYKSFVTLKKLRRPLSRV